MALAIDASTPAVASGTGTTVTTSSFTTPANVLLVAFVGRNGANSADNDTGTVSGAGLTWTLAGRKSSVGTGQITGGTAQPGCAEIWWAYSSSALTSQTVTDTRAANNGAGYDHAIQVMVITGAETTWAGAITATGSASGLPSLALTTTAANAWVMSAVSDWAQKGLGTVGSGQTMISEYNNTGQISIHFWRQTATTTTSGTAVTDNLTAPSAEQYNMLSIEIRPAATGTPVSLTGVVAAVTIAAPAGTVATQVNIALTGVVASTTIAAPAGTVAASGPVSLTGAVASVTVGAPAGSVSATSPIALTGAVAGVSTAAPAGTLALSVSLTTSPASITTGAPAGTVKLSVSLTGPVANSTTAAPAGTIALSVSLTGPVAGVSIGAPAGTVLAQGPISLTGAVASVTTSAPAGTVTTSTGPITISGPVATLTSGAPAGTVNVVVSVTYYFTPPTQRLHYGNWPTQPLTSRIGYPTGACVLKSQGFYTTRWDSPTQADINSADAVYLGGHVYPITKAEADALTAAGYGANITVS